MDKNTLSNYGWVVCVILVLAIMISLATPFGNVIKNEIAKTVTNLKDNAEGVLDNMGGATSFDDLGGGSGGAGGIGGGDPQPPSVEELQEQHEFKYYSTLSAAVTDVNNAAIGENADVDKENAVAGIYTENGDTYVVLLKDTTEATRITTTADMTLNLGGHVLTGTDILVINNKGGNVSIDGSLEGSGIHHVMSASGATVQTVSGMLSVNGGTYSATNINSDVTSSQTNIFLIKDGSLDLVDCNITNQTSSDSSSGISGATGGNNSISVLGCDIKVANTLGNAYGVKNSCNLLMDNCDVKVYANYTSDYSQGGNGVAAISNAVSMTINNCNITGIHSGVSVSGGTLYVNGGTYQGYGHGGFYFANADGTSYVRNATMRQCAMPEGYTDFGGGCNESGFYIGGGADNNNITVYMDNCDIYGVRHPIVLRGSSGEQNNTLYISNSTINLDYTLYGVRIDSYTHKLYIGAGCNFTVENTYLSTVVTQTDEVYVQ